MDTVFRRYLDLFNSLYEESKTDRGRVLFITVSEGTAKPYVVIQNDRPDIILELAVLIS